VTNRTAIKMGGRLRFLAALTACIAPLVFAAMASAEVRSGESTTSVILQSPSPELTLVGGSGSYDTNGSMKFSFTTTAPPQAEVGGEPNLANFEVVLLHMTGECTPAAITMASQEGKIYPPIAWINGHYGSALTESRVGLPPAHLEDLGPATKVVSGATTTLSLSSAKLASLEFNCAGVLAYESTVPRTGSEMFFPISAIPALPVAPESGPSASPPVVSPSSSTSPSPPPVAAAKLLIARPKPVTVEVGKWKTVKVKLTNRGGSPTSTGSLRVRPARGVSVRPETQKLPSLKPGESWTISVRVELTAAAGIKSRLALIGVARGSAVFKSSLVVKAKP
jgi:hypothetical protein